MKAILALEVNRDRRLLLSIKHDVKSSQSKLSSMSTVFEQQAKHMEEAKWAPLSFCDENGMFYKYTHVSLRRHSIESFYETGPHFGELEQQQLNEIALLKIAMAEQDRQGTQGKICLFFCL